MVDNSSEVPDFEIGDVESYSSKKENFSHSNLIMKCLNRCADTGSVEMVEGRVDHRKDKSGNYVAVHVPDTRLTFIEAVKTCKNFMICDFDNQATNNIKQLLKRIAELKKYWIGQEHNWFNSLSWNEQQHQMKIGLGIMKESFNLKNQFHNHFVTAQVDIYRDILEELTLLTQRKDFYAEEIFEA
jgi:hypothetical protein